MKKLLVILAAAALVCAFTVPAPAADWNFYGSARLATFYISDDYGDFVLASTGDDGDSELQWDMQSNSRLGATVKGENVKGQVELGITQTPNGSSGDAARVRRLYGTWNFGAGTFKVGKDYTPVSQFISGQVFAGDNGLLGYGTYYGFRRGQAALSFGGFNIAAITTSTSNLGAVGDVDSYIPKLEASWGMGFDNFSFGLMGGFQTYTIEDATSLVDGRQNDVDVDSYVIGAMGTFNIGPGYIKGSVAYDQNGFEGGWLTAIGAPEYLGFSIWDGDDDVNDVNTFQAALVGGFKMSDMLSFEGGFGYADIDWDVDGFDNYAQWNAYVQAVVVMAPGVYVIPEVGYFDFGDFADDSDIDQGNTFYAGAKWQIDF